MVKYHEEKDGHNVSDPLIFKGGPTLKQAAKRNSCNKQFHLGLHGGTELQEQQTIPTAVSKDRRPGRGQRLELRAHSPQPAYIG